MVNTFVRLFKKSKTSFYRKKKLIFWATSPFASQRKPPNILNTKIHYGNQKNQTKQSDANTTDGYLTDCQWCIMQKLKKNTHWNKTFTNVCYIFNIILSVTFSQCYNCYWSSVAFRHIYWFTASSGVSIFCLFTARCHVFSDLRLHFIPYGDHFIIRFDHLCLSDVMCVRIFLKRYFPIL